MCMLLDRSVCEVPGAHVWHPSSDEMCIQLLELCMLYMLLDGSVCKVPRTCM